MNRVLFFLLLVLSVVCVGAVAAADGGIPGEDGPGEPAARGEVPLANEKARAGLETTGVNDRELGRSDSLDGVPEGGLDPKGPVVDLKGPKVKLEEQEGD
ncbi:uncharacterized protein TM35_000681070, partial [Trypanosoma theileri]